MGTESRFNHLAAATALNKMLNEKDWFDITTLEAVGKALGVNVRNSTNYNALNVLHCVHYSEMPRELYNNLGAEVAKALSVTGIGVKISIEPPADNENLVNLLSFKGKKKDE